tara:strand:+ start:9580 stop:10278 length:699 start_codon:yes stop_codon:yes gene_type:complete
MKSTYLYSNQLQLLGDPKIIGFGNDSFYIKEISRDYANSIIKKNHYSKKVYAGSYIHLGLFVNSQVKGVLQYGYAMNPASCDKVVAKTGKDQYLELNRMWLEDNIGEYPESRAISYSCKFIRKEYPKIKWIQSFADERCGGYGVVYQACSFKYYGEHTSTFWELDGEVYHNIQMTLSKKDHRYNKTVHHLQQNKDKAKKMILRQFRYIKFFKERYSKHCLLNQEPYPKRKNI